jgi:hypothetical protein
MFLIACIIAIGVVNIILFIYAKKIGCMKNELLGVMVCSFIPIVQIILLFAVLGDLQDFNPSKNEALIDYKKKYKHLKKALMSHKILTEQEIKELEDSITIIDKMTSIGE